MKLHWPDVAVVIGCLIAFAVGTAFSNKELKAEKERADAYQKVMVACLNSGGFFFRDTQRAYICSAKEI